MPTIKACVDASAEVLDAAEVRTEDGFEMLGSEAMEVEGEGQDEKRAKTEGKIEVEDEGRQEKKAKTEGTYEAGSPGEDIVKALRGCGGWAKNCSKHLSFIERRMMASEFLGA